MNYGMIKWYDIANGEGVRVSLFVSGCDHHCKGCFQPETWDYDYGQPYTQEVEDQILDSIKNIGYIKGLSLLGGDPFCGDNPKHLLNLVKKVQEYGKTVWCYTGYTYEELLTLDKEKPEIVQMMHYIDVLVDGPFIEEKKNIMLRFCGSENQRLIRCRESSIDNILLYEVDDIRRG